jgi:hypothetical protein
MNNKAHAALAALAAVGFMTIVGTVVYVATHFIVKYW